MKKFLLILLLASLSFFDANASLMVNPTRLEFDYSKEQNQVKNVRLFNNSNSKKSYRISFQHLKMNEKGDLVEIKNPSKEEVAKFVDDVVLFSPKRVVLEPKTSQVVRLFLKNSPNFSASEHRSHLLISEEEIGSSNSSKKEKNKSISVEIKALLSVSIPVIVNNGPKNSKIEFGEVLIKENEVLVDLLRSGNSTIYGDLILLADGKEVLSVGYMSVFYPSNKRRVSLKLKNSLNGKNLELVFYERNLINDNYELNKTRPLAKKNILSK